MSKTKNVKKRKKFKYSALTKSNIAHLKSADRCGTKAYSLWGNFGPDKPGYETARKKSIYHEKVVSRQLDKCDVLSAEEKKRIWDSID